MPAFDNGTAAGFDAANQSATDPWDDGLRAGVSEWFTRPKPHAKPHAKPGDPPKLRPLVSLDEFALDLEATDFVQGVLVEGGLTVVYGDSNAGKTFWATDLALHVAAGKPWNGRRVDQGGVVYVSMEGDKRFRNRAVAWRDANDDYPPGLPFYGDFSALNLLDPDADTGPLIETIHATSELACPVKLVVVDTFARALGGGDENGSQDMGALVRNADRIRRETGANILFIHHCGKDAAKGARGHSSLRAAVDTEIEVVCDPDTGVRTATVVKQRDLAKPPAFGFRLDVVTLGQNQHGEDVTTCLVAGADVDNAALPKRGRGRPGRLNEESMTLLGEIENAINGQYGECRHPEPDMPVCPTVKRKVLQFALIKAAWLQTEPVPISPGNSGHVFGELPKSEHKRLWQRLNQLKAHGKIGFNTFDVWLVT